MVCCNYVKVEDMGVQMAKKVVAAVGRDLLMNLDVAVEDVVCIPRNARAVLQPLPTVLTRSSICGPCHVSVSHKPCPSLQTPV